MDKSDIFAIIILLLIFASPFYLAHIYQMNHCEGRPYDNPDIGGCGIYSQSELDKMWCEDNGGYFIRGSNFAANNCIFPQQ